MRKIAATALAAVLALAASPPSAEAAALTCTSDGMLCYSVTAAAWSDPSVTALTFGDAPGRNGAVSSGYQALDLGPEGNGLTVYTYGNAGVYHGNSSLASAPVVPGGAQNYLAIPTNGGNMDAVFDVSQKYVSFLWGAPKNGNAATFYSGNDALATITGADVRSAAGAYEGNGGTYLVSFRPGDAALASGMLISEVYFQTTSNQDFSVSNISYSAADNSPVGPAPLPALAGTPIGAAFLLFGAIRRRRAKAATAA